jgi:hypothetical protein
MAAVSITPGMHNHKRMVAPDTISSGVKVPNSTQAFTSAMSEK